MLYKMSDSEVIGGFMNYLSPVELLRVLSEAKKHGSREHCAFLLAYKHGLRASEICKLTLDDVRNGEINVRRCKESLHTVQPLQSHDNPLLDEKRALTAWLRERGDADGSAMLFTSRNGSGLSRQQIYNLFYDIAMRAGIDKSRRFPHICKHSLGAHLVRNGVGLAYVQQALGHKHISSTVRYTHITAAESAEKVGEVMNRVFA
jgi:site-specific recombinase XerD